MRNKETKRNTISFKKFQIAKIKNPQKIYGGNQIKEDETDSGGMGGHGGIGDRII